MQANPLHAQSFLIYVNPIWLIESDILFTFLTFFPFPD